MDRTRPIFASQGLQSAPLRANRNPWLAKMKHARQREFQLFNQVVCTPFLPLPQIWNVGHFLKNVRGVGYWHLKSFPTMIIFTCY